MEERKEAKRHDKHFPKLIFWLFGLYSILALLLLIFWTGSSFGLVFLLLSGLVFLISLMFPQVGFSILLVSRIIFDSWGDQEVLSLFDVSLTPTIILGVMLIFLTLLTVILKRQQIFKIPVAKSWVIFLSIIAALSVFSFSKQASAVELFRFLSFFSAFIFGYLIFNTPKKLTNLAKIIIFSGLIPAGVAWYQLLNRGGFFDGERWRLVGTFVHPNMLAFYLVLIICLSLFVSLHIKEKTAVERIPYALLVVFFTIPLLFTYTRAAWLGLALIIFSIGVYRFKKLLLFSILSFAFLFIFFPFFQERVSTLFTFSVSDSSTWRLDLWRDIWGYIKSQPWFGYGPGTADIFIKKNIPRFLIETEPHNDYLRIWLESGIFALISYVLIYLNYLKKMWQGFKLENRPRLRMLIFFLSFFTISLGAASITDNIIKDAVMQWIFWSLSGGVFAITAISQTKKESR